MRRAGVTVVVCICEKGFLDEGVCVYIYLFTYI